jgi:hypothetical protein
MVSGLTTRRSGGICANSAAKAGSFASIHVVLRARASLREDVVGGDDVVGYPEKVEDRGRDDPRSILPGGAVEHRWKGVVATQHVEGTGDRPAELFRDADVALARCQGLREPGSELRGIARRQLHAVEHRDVVPRDIRVRGHELTVIFELGTRTEIDHRAQTEHVELLDVGRRQPMQGVRAVEHIPTHPPAVRRLVTAEVAEVEARLELDMARRFAHACDATEPTGFASAESGVRAHAPPNVHRSFARARGESFWER